MNKGMAMLINVIILGALMVVIGMAITLSAVNEGQSTLMETKQKRNLNLLEACAEESLLRINENNALPPTIVTTLGNCSVTINSQVGTSWNVSIGASGEMAPMGINMVLNRGSSLSITSWSDQ